MNRILGFILFGLFSIYMGAVGAAVEGTKATFIEASVQVAAKTADFTDGFIEVVKSIKKEAETPHKDGVSAEDIDSPLVGIAPTRKEESEKVPAKSKHTWRWWWNGNGMSYMALTYIPAEETMTTTSKILYDLLNVVLLPLITVFFVLSTVSNIFDSILNWNARRKEIALALSDELYQPDNAEVFELEDLGMLLGAVKTVEAPTKASFLKKLLFVAGVAVVVAAFTGGTETATFAAAVTPSFKSGDELKKAQSLKKRVKASVQKFKLKAERAAGYQLFPTLVVIGESHGSQAEPTLHGRNAFKKARAPKVQLTSSGRWNAAVIKQLLEINTRRVADGKNEWLVGPTDIIFTEFRNGSNPESIVKAMKALGYVPAGPGIFLKLKEGEESNEYNRWILKICRTAKDARSYGRSYTTSPVLEFISHRVPVHMVSLKAMGVGTDGASFVTQGLEGISSLAFQARFISSPKDMWVDPDQMDYGLCKGLFVQAKIVKNVTTGEAQWVADKILWKKLKKAGILDKDCPIVEVEGVEYQAGFFMDTSNMAKADVKKKFKALANGKKVTTLDGSNFIAFVIAEQFAGRTSLGWQTIQLLHTKILKKHKDALKGKIDKKLEFYMSDNFDENLTKLLTKKQNGLRAIPTSAISCINMLKSLSGKGMGRLIFGAGLTTTSDYVLEMEDMPAGWAVHNPPKSTKHDHYGNTASWSADSRYPQQGFESLIAMKNISATQVARLYEHVVLGNNTNEPNDKDIVKGDTGKFLAALDKKCGGDADRVKLVLTALKATLPFVKIGCKIISHDDQFGRLRGDSDGDKNFWTYDKTIVAIVKEVEKVAKSLPLPRLEVEGDGMIIDKAFDNNNYLDIALEGIKPGKAVKYTKVANLLCAQNNGQGPVGLIYNLTTVPLSRLKWDIVDNGNGPEIVWEKQESAKFFAYLLLMGQTAIDMQKRIYPAPSLIRWSLAKLFAKPGEKSSLTGPKSPKDTGGDYRMLAQDEVIWTMSPKMSMAIDVYHKGLMYNERALSHWAAWVLNGVEFEFDFLTAKDDKVLVAEKASKILADKGLEEFYQYLSEITGKDLDLIQEKWVLTEDLITWKKNANLNEVIGKPAAGIEFVWNIVIDSWKELKAKSGVNGKDPIESIASLYSDEIQMEANSGTTGRYVYLLSGKKKVEEFTIQIQPGVWKGLFKIFAEITDKNRKDVSESEFMQGDIPSDPSAMKRMLREIFDHPRVEADGLLRGMSFKIAGKPMPVGLVLNKLFSNDSNWPPQKRKQVGLALFRNVYACIVVLAKHGEAGETKGAISKINKLTKLNLFRGKEGFVKACPDGADVDSWNQMLEANENLIARFSEIWSSDQNKALTKAVRRWGMPTFTDRGMLGVKISGSGYPTGKANEAAALNFIRLVRDSYKDHSSLKVAEWLADSIWPVLGLIWDLTEENVLRANVLNEKTLLDDGDFNVYQIYVQNPKRIASAVSSKISFEAMLVECIMDKFPGKSGKDARESLLSIIEFFKNTDGYDIYDVVTVDDFDMESVVEEVMTSRFQRKITTRIRPLAGAARALIWYGQWYDWASNKGTAEATVAKRKAYAAEMTRRSLFNFTYVRDDDGQIVVDERTGTMQVKTCWLKSSVDFTIPAAFSADLFHEMLESKFSASGMYILCQEARAKGKYSIGRWCYFDNLTYRLVKANLPTKTGKTYGPKSSSLLMKAWLAAHMDGRSEISIGMAYHRQHYLTAVNWCKNIGDKAWHFAFSNAAPSGNQLALVQETVNRFLLAYLFSYSPKEGKDKNLIEVRLPFAFGSNNKLASISDKDKFFMSSKLWMVLASLGIVDFDSMDFSTVNAMWKSVYGFNYPTKGKDKGQASLAPATASNAKTKVHLPWFTAGTSREEARSIYNLTVGAGYGNSARTLLGQGMPSPQEAINKAIWLRYDNEHTFDGIKKRNNSTHKAILGVLGISSVEYQFELLTEANLANPAKTDFVKPVSRSWASTSVSGLRDLFGGLGDYQGWSVGQTHYVRSMRTMDKQTLLLVLKEFWTQTVEDDVLNASTSILQIDESTNLVCLKSEKPVATKVNLSDED